MIFFLYMADDSASVSAPPSQDTSSAPVSHSDQTAPPSDIGQQPDSTWPNSTNLANDQLSADSNLANNSQATPSAEPVPSVPAESPPPPSFPSSSPSPIPVPESPPAPETTPEPSEAVKPPEEKVNTDVQLLDNQATMEQQEAPKDIPAVDAEKTADQLANFKPELPEQPQEAPLANLSAETLVKEDQNVTDSTKKSFGDLLSSENQPPPTPSVPPVPSSPSVSFGDLIKDLKPEESVIPPPPPVPPATPPISSTPQPISPPSPVSPIYPTSSQTGDLSLRRQKANKVRSQKKANHLSKIMELAKNAKSISNTDIQRLLRVPQSTATNYLSELSRKGLLKKQGIRGGTKYTL